MKSLPHELPILVGIHSDSQRHSQLLENHVFLWNLYKWNPLFQEISFKTEIDHKPGQEQVFMYLTPYFQF